jgi:hypothetical protein
MCLRRWGDLHLLRSGFLMLTRETAAPLLTRGVARAITWVGVRILVASAVLWLAG